MPIELITAIVAGVFVIIGGIIGAVSGWWAEKQRYKRELRSRWDNDIRQQSAEFLSQVDTYIHNATILESAKLTVTPDDSDIAKDQRARVDELDMIRRRSFQSLYKSQELLSFIAPSSLNEAAKSLASTVTIADKGLVEDSWRTLRQIDDKKTTFVSEVRKALKITSVDQA